MQRPRSADRSARPADRFRRGVRRTNPRAHSDAYGGTPVNIWKKYASAATVAAVLAGGALVASAQGASAAGAAGWTQFQADLAGSGDNTGDTGVNPGNAATLQAAWVAHGGRASSAQPLVVGGTVYWGSWDGNVHATSLASGASLWTRAIGTTTC